MTESDDERPRGPATATVPAKARWWGTELGTAVARRVAHLQDASNRNSADAIARLAQLRRAVGTVPGSVPDAWADTIGIVPDGLLGRGDSPSAAELAAHHTLSLFALHRRGRVTEAHLAGRGLGEAVRLLARQRAGGGQDDESEGVRRRFDALVTASTPDEGAHHLRGIVLMLASQDIALDYGRLAEDLAALWTPRLRDGVRLRWARQYRHVRRQGDDAIDSTDITTSPEESA